MMKLSPQGAVFVGHHEGWVGKWYADPVGIGTIGFGFTWASASFRKWWAKHRPGQKFGPGATMTRDEGAEVLALLMDEEYGAAVNGFLGTMKVAQHVFDGMCSPVFNAGAGTLTDRWAKALKAGDIDGAADLLKTTRITAKGKRLQGLVNRRLDEAELIGFGDYTIGRPRAAAKDAMADGILVRRESGPAVVKLQQDLQALGLYKDGKPDGIFGPGTESAVMEFQRSAGLKDDGFAGPRTLAAIVEALAAFTVAPAPHPGGLSQPPAIIVDEPAAPAPAPTPQPGGVVSEMMSEDECYIVIETALAILRRHKSNRSNT